MIIVLNLKRFLLLKTTVYVQSFLARIKDRATSKVATVDQIPSSSHSITLNWKLCYLLESYFMFIFFFQLDIRLGSFIHCFLIFNENKRYQSTSLKEDIERFCLVNVEETMYLCDQLPIKVE